MISGKDIINNIDELLYEIIDNKGNIIYPNNSENIKKIEDIVNNKDINDIAYVKENEKWYECHTKRITKDNNEFTIKYLIDVTNIKKEEKKYQIDTLTSVYTRSNILKTTGEELINCSENNLPFAIVICDIDHFKNVNDTYGHIVGDKVLEQIGNIFLKYTKDNNTFVGRYGGEEFLLFFKDTSIENIINKISNISQDLNNIKIIYKDNVITNITMSFGIYYSDKIEYKDISENNINEILSELIYNADTALYSCKNSGRNQAQFYNENIFKKIYNQKNLSN